MQIGSCQPKPTLDNIECFENFIISIFKTKCISAWIKANSVLFEQQVRQNQHYSCVLFATSFNIITCGTAAIITSSSAVAEKPRCRVGQFLVGGG